MSAYIQGYGFHAYEESILVGHFQTTYRPDTEFTYTFENFFHPYVGRLIEQLNRKSLPGLLDATFHASLTVDFFEKFYEALAESQQASFGTFPRLEIDVSDGGPYAGYNWELLFHVPFLIAVHLSKNQRFAEAMRWFHFVFDPTSTDTSIDPPERFWKFLRFRQEADAPQVDEILMLLSKPDSECTATELERKVMIMEGYQAIKDHPFQPHRVARTRVIAYQYAVLMKYLDNLIAWGDHLFAQDTIESINEATQRYVLAANLLGPRPSPLPPRGVVRHRSYRELKDAGLDPLGNALVELEGKFPFNVALPSAAGDTGDDLGGPLLGIGRTLYFCVPRNEKLLGYWDIVDDRLRKIRNCMNLQGVVRSLALFDPPLDPGMLVKAAAAGIDVGSIVAGLNQPIGPVRAQLMLQRALELCGEVKSLGAALLAAIEKREGEQLTLLRQGHELRVQELSQGARFLQWKQAEEATESLLRSRASALERYDFYMRAIGMARDKNAIPDTFVLGQRPPITEETFDETFAALVGQFDRPVAPRAYAALRLAAQTSPAAGSGAVGTGPLFLNANEIGRPQHLRPGGALDPGRLDEGRHDRRDPGAHPRHGHRPPLLGHGWSRQHLRRVDALGCGSLLRQCPQPGGGNRGVQGRHRHEDRVVRAACRRLGPPGQPGGPRAHPDRPPTHRLPDRRADGTPGIPHGQGADRADHGRGRLPAREVLERGAVRLDAGRTVTPLLRVLPLRLRHRPQGRADGQARADAA